MTTTDRVIGHLTRAPTVRVVVRKAGRRRDAFLVSSGVRPTVLYRGLPDHWSDVEIGSYLEQRDAALYAQAGGVTWRNADV